MARLKLFAVCERALVEEGTRTLSLLSLVEQVRFPQLPPAPPNHGEPVYVPYRFAVVHVWEREDPNKPETFDTRVRLIGTNGKEFGHSEQRVDMTSFRVSRVILQAPMFPWTGPGDMYVEIQLRSGKRWRTVGKERVEVVDASGTPT